MPPASALRRVASLLLGLWLALFIAEPASMHACAVHDGAGAPASHHSHHHAPAHSGGGSDNHSCTCPGACCPATGAQVPTRTTIVGARVLTIDEPELATATVAIATSTQLALPPALGPPGDSD